MADLFWEPDAWGTCTRMDSQRRGLRDAVEDVLDRLADDPAQAAVRVVALTSRGGIHLWRVPIRQAVDDWSLVWLSHPSRPDDVVIVYLGPANYAGA